MKVSWNDIVDHLITMLHRTKYMVGSVVVLPPIFIGVAPIKHVRNVVDGSLSTKQTNNVCNVNCTHSKEIT